MKRRHPGGLAEQLAGGFTVYAYDRRGRGDSDPGASTYSVAREIEDLVAVIGAAGGRAHVFGASSGGALALEASRQGAPIERIAVYEAPFIVDDARPAIDPHRQLSGAAHTLPYDLSIVIDHQRGRSLPGGYYDDVRPEAIVIAGGRSPAYMRNAQAAIAAAVPHARLETLAGQTHMVKPRVLAPVLAGFLAD